MGRFVPGSRLFPIPTAFEKAEYTNVSVTQQAGSMIALQDDELYRVVRVADAEGQNAP